MNELELSWDKYLDCVYQLKKRIQFCNWHTLPIVAIAKGGLIPASIISDDRVYSVGIQTYDASNKQDRMVHYQSPFRTTPTPKEVLIIDDLIDTGLTLHIAKKILVGVRPDIKIKVACLFHKGKVELDLNCLALEWVQDKWIKFPYEA